MHIFQKVAVIAAFSSLFAGAGKTPHPPVSGDAPVPLRLTINIPASRLDVYEYGELTRSYPVSPGARGFETPAGEYRVYRVVWNPWWHPPNSKWAASRKIEPPGPLNPMGRVKLQFSNLLYVHGTTDETRLGTRGSHGCVRMSNQDLMELTRLVHYYTTPSLPTEVIDQLAANPQQTRTFELRRNVPLSVTYNLVEVRDRQLTIHPDVYRARAAATFKQQVLTALQKAGIDVRSIDASRLEQITRIRRGTRLTIALDTLVAGSGTHER